MTDTWVPSPPAQSVWWDPAATFKSVTNTLRLQQVDVDADKLKALIPAAGEQINNYFDRIEPLDASTSDGLDGLQAALERLTIMLYHGIDPDPIGTIAAQLTPSKQRWGIG